MSYLDRLNETLDLYYSQMLIQDELDKFKYNIEDRSEHYYQTLGKEVGDEFKTLEHHIKLLDREIAQMYDKIDFLSDVCSYLPIVFANKISKYRVGQKLLGDQVVTNISIEDGDIFIWLHDKDKNVTKLNEMQLHVKESLQSCLKPYPKNLEFVTGGIKVDGQVISLGEVNRHVHTVRIKEFGLKLVKIDCKFIDVYHYFLSPCSNDEIISLLVDSSPIVMLEEVEIIEDFDQVFEFYINNEPTFDDMNYDIVEIVKEYVVSNCESVDEMILKYSNLVY